MSSIKNGPAKCLHRKTLDMHIKLQGCINNNSAFRALAYASQKVTQRRTNPRSQMTI